MSPKLKRLNCDADKPALCFTGGTCSFTDVVDDGSALQAKNHPGKKKLKRFSMAAYSGGVMNIFGFGKVVVDLAGMDIGGGKPRPILQHHDPKLIVGHSDTVEISGGALTVGGVISGAGAPVEEVLATSQNGFPWQASIGADVTRSEFLEGGETAVVNGQEVVGPLTIISGSRLREISFVPVGADDQTSASVAAAASPHRGGGFIMDFKKWLAAHGFAAESDLSDKQKQVLRASFAAEQKAAKNPPAPTTPPLTASTPPMPAADLTSTVKAAVGNALLESQKNERERIASITATCAGEYETIQAQAIREGWTETQTNAAIIKAMREHRPNINTLAASGDPAEENMVLEAALCMRGGLDEKSLLASYGEKVVTAAYQDRTISLKEFLQASLRTEGVQVGRTFDGEMLRAAASTVSVPGILGNVANKMMLRSFSQQAPIAPMLCSAADLTDFKVSDRYRLNDLGDLEEVGADGRLKQDKVSEESATNQLSTYGKMFGITRQMVINDDLGAFLKIPEAMGGKAARKIDKLFFKRLLSNPGGLFSSGNNNYKTGAATALDANSLAVAIQMFLDQKDAEKEPINIQPHFLLVPTALKFIAKQLVNSGWLNSAGSTDKTNITTYNPHADENLQVVAAPHLSNSNYTGNSALAWYLFGDPSVTDTFEIGYLRGARTPTIERFDAQPDTLGFGYRAYFDLGVREQDFRGMTKMKGS